MNAHENLLPCPFCGSTTVSLIRPSARLWTVLCGVCSASSRHANSRDGAAADWNRRASPAQLENAFAKRYFALAAQYDQVVAELLDLRAAGCHHKH
jgi:Lar family restriction alleviation protein